MAKFWDSSSGLGDAKWLRDLWTDLLGGSDHSSDYHYQEKKNLHAAADSLLGPEGFLAYPKRTWDHWADQLSGGRSDDDDTLLTRNEEEEEEEKENNTIIPVDEGLGDPHRLQEMFRCPRISHKNGGRLGIRKDGQIRCLPEDKTLQMLKTV